MDKRRMCPHCRAFITTSDKICPYCDAKVGPRAIDLRSPADLLGGLIPASRFTTSMILLVNVGFYVATAVVGIQAGRATLMDVDGLTLFEFGAKYRQSILGGELWRLVTAGFLHGGVFHILMNSWVLVDLGAQVEESFGVRRYIVIYFAATVAGFMASTWWSASLSIGASAGVFGLIGAMIALGMQSRSAIAAAIKAHYIRWAIWGLAMGLLPLFRVDNAAHLGGLAGGFLVAYAAGTPRLVDNWREKLWGAAAMACALVTFYCFAQMFLRLNR